MCFILKDKDQDLKLVPLFWFLPLMVGGYHGKSLTHPSIIKISPYLDKISLGSKILYFMGLVLSCKIIISEKFYQSVELEERT